MYNFDEVINRKNTNSSKWDNVGVRVGNPDAIPMWVADMDFRCPREVVEAVVKKAEFGIYGYPVVPEKYRTVTTGWLKKRHGWGVDPKDILYTSSVIPAMFSVVQAFTVPGDKVLLQRPVYYPFSHSIEQQDRQVANSPLRLVNGKYEIDFETLEQYAADPAVKLMLLCNPHNPAGRVFTKDELQKVGEICCRNHVLIFSDEIHSDFIYGDNRHIPIASLSDEFAMNTITAIAPSKTFNLAGMRSASLIIHNEKLRVAVADVLNRNRSALPSVMGIEAYIAAYEYGETYLEELLSYLQGNIRFLDGFLKERMPKIKLIWPEGTYLMWLDCRELKMDKEQLDEFFLWKAAVALDKGFWFGENEGNGFMRMNVACPRKTLEKALLQIEKEYLKL